MRKSSAGFTLLEILVVLLIVGLIASVVVVSISGSNYKTELRTATYQISRQIELARNESTFRNELWGVEIKRNTMRFLKFDPVAETWNSLTKRAYIAKRLSENVELQLNTKDVAQSFQSDELEDSTPNLIIEPSGEITPFEITIEYVPQNLAWYIYSDGLEKAEITTEKRSEYEELFAQ